VEGTVKLDSIPFVPRVLGSRSWVQGTVDCFGKEWAQFVGFVAMGSKVAVESEGFYIGYQQRQYRGCECNKPCQGQGRTGLQGGGRNAWGCTNEGSLLFQRLIRLGTS
jgi:hypothetical protein